MTLRSIHREDGFVLLAVLGLTALISALAVGFLLLARNDYRDAISRRDLARARIIADNVLVRVIAAIGNPGDPLHGPAMRVNVPLRFDEQGVSVIVEIEPESGKIDINRADPGFIRSALNRIGATPADTDAMLDRILEARNAGRFIHEPQSILSPAQHYDAIAGRVVRTFATAPGAVGVTAILASRVVLESIPGISPEEAEALHLGLAPGGAANSGAQAKYRLFLTPSRPIYTLRARVEHATLPPLRRSVGLAYLNLPIRRRPDVAILWWRGENW